VTAEADLGLEKANRFMVGGSSALRMLVEKRRVKVKA